MILGLRICNLAVIEAVELSLGSGLTVMTGETGAGKSILVDALGLLLGSRADAEVVRAGCEEASVEGLVRKTPLLAARLAELGLPDLGDEVSVRRVVAASGRGKAYVNGALVTVGVLARLMRGLVDIAGQHEHMSLFDPAHHRELIDALGALQTPVEGYRAEYLSLQRLEARAAELGGDPQVAAARLEFLRFQLEELDRLSPEPGEDAALEEERRRLLSSERLRRAAGQAEQLISQQDGAALETTGRALAALAEAGRLDDRLAPVLSSLEAARAELDEAARAVGRYAQALDADPHRLALVDERLDALRRLCRKHAAPLSGVIDKREALCAELVRLTNRQSELDALEVERQAVVARARAAASTLTAARKDAARGFERSVLLGLRDLAMGKAAFEARVRPLEALGEHGADEVEFFFSANVGEPPRPLAKVASGGEASRVLLALRRALAAHDGCATYVLDEADAGVGGAVAEAVGRMIHDVSRHRQVLCITHLPQVAAFADTHWVISKEQRRGRTHSRVSPLTCADARAKELGRMLSGAEVTREALRAAESLMRSALRRVDAPARARVPPAIEPRGRRSA